MRAANLWRTLPALILLLTLAAAAATAGDEPPAQEKDRPETITIAIEDDDFVLTSRCDGREKVVTVNMDAIGDMIGEAMSEFSTALGELDDLQLDIRLGEDNRLGFADAQTEWEVDLDRIFEQVGAALEAGFAEVDTDEWTNARDRDEHDMKNLQKELDRLQKELKRLQRELEERSGGDD